MKNFIYLLIGSLFFAGIAYAAPNYTYQTTLLPLSNNLYDLGTSTNAWRNIYTNNITISGTCTGCGSSGTISTSSPLTAGLLVQSTAWNTIANIATSSLGLGISSFASPNISQWTDNVGYLTPTTFDVAFDTRLTATTTLPNITTLAGLLLPYSQLTGTVPTWNQNTTGNAATVTTNANLTGDVTSVGNATSFALGIPHIWTALQSFANATSTLFSSTYASSTSAYFGTAYIPNLGTSAGSFLAVNSTGQVIATTTPSGGSGTVTSVAETVPSFLSITGSPITTSGTLALSYSGTALPLLNGGTGLTAVGASSTVLTTNGTVAQWNTLATSQLTNDSGFLTSSTAVTTYNGVSGAVTGVSSIASANGVSGTVSSGAATLTLGAITPTTVNGLAVSLGANSNSSNVAIGTGSLSANTTGNSNTANGVNALQYNTTGYENTANGKYALGQNSTGNNNVALGYGAGYNATGSNSFYVNNVTQTSLANDKAYSLLYGTFSGTAGSLTGQQLTVNGNEYINGNVGIATSTPAAKLDVYTSTASSTPLLLESVSGGGCIIIKDVAGTGYTQEYTMAGVIYSEVHTGPLTSCN